MDNSTGSDSGPSRRVCICRQPYDGTAFMIECAMCDGWFHGSCIGLTPQDAVNITEYFCPECSRSHSPSANGNVEGSLSGSGTDAEDSEDSLSDSDLIAILSRPSLPGAGKGKGFGKGKAPRQQTAKTPRSAAKAPYKSATVSHHSSKVPRSTSTSAGKAPRSTRMAGKKMLFTHMAASTTDDDDSDSINDDEASSSSSSSSSSSASSSSSSASGSDSDDAASEPHVDTFPLPSEHEVTHKSDNHYPQLSATAIDPSSTSPLVALERSAISQPPIASTASRRAGRGGGRGRGRGTAAATGRSSLIANEPDSFTSKSTADRPSRIARKVPRTAQPLPNHADDGDHASGTLRDPSNPSTVASIVNTAMSASSLAQASLSPHSKSVGRPRKSSASAARPRSDSLSSKRTTTATIPPSSSAANDEPLITESDFEKLMAHSSSHHQSASTSFGPRLGQAVSSMLLPSLADDSDTGSSSKRNNKSGTIRVPVSPNPNGSTMHSHPPLVPSFRFSSNSASTRSKPQRPPQPIARAPSLFPMYPPIPTPQASHIKSSLPTGNGVTSGLPIAAARSARNMSSAPPVDDDETDIETEDDADATVDDEEDDDDLDDDMCVVCDTTCTCKPKQPAGATPLPLSPPKPTRLNAKIKPALPALPSASASPKPLSLLPSNVSAPFTSHSKTKRAASQPQAAPPSRTGNTKKRSAAIARSPPPLRPMAPSTIMSPHATSRKQTGAATGSSPLPLPSPPRPAVARPTNETESDDEDELVVHVPRPPPHLPPSRFGRAPSLGLSDGTVSSGDSTLSDADSDFASEVLGVISAHPTGPPEPMDEEEAVRANVSTFAGLAAAALALLSDSDSSSSDLDTNSDISDSSDQETSSDEVDDTSDDGLASLEQFGQHRSNVVDSASIQADADATEDEMERALVIHDASDAEDPDSLIDLDGEADVTFTEYQTDDSSTSSSKAKQKGSSISTRINSHVQSDDEDNVAMDLGLSLSAPSSSEFDVRSDHFGSQPTPYPSFVQSVVAGSSPSLYKDGYNHSVPQHALSSRTRKISLKDFGLGFLAPPAKRPRDDHLPTTFEAASPPEKPLLTSSHLRQGPGEPPTKRQRRPPSNLAPIIINPLTAIANDMATSPFTFQRPDGTPHTPTTPAMLGLDQIVDADLFASSEDDDLAALQSSSPNKSQIRSPHNRDGRVRKLSTTSQAFSAFRAHDQRINNATDPHRAFKGHTNTDTLLVASLGSFSPARVDTPTRHAPLHPEKVVAPTRRGSISRYRRTSSTSASVLRHKAVSQDSSETNHVAPAPSPLEIGLNLDTWIADPSHSQDFFTFAGGSNSATLSHDVDPDFMAMDALFSETQK